MSWTRARVVQSKSRIAVASPCDYGRYQPGDGLSPGEAGRDDLDYEPLKLKDLEEQIFHLDQQQEHPTSAYVVVPPNPARRNRLQQIATKEMEELEKWKEQHKSRPVYLTPQKLGGRASEAEVRQNQQLENVQAKYYQKLKREEYRRRQREAEEADILKKKMVQREKAEKREEKRQREEWQRQQMLDEDDDLITSQLLRRLALDPDLAKRTSNQSENRALKSTPWARSHAYKQLQRQAEDQKLQEMKDEQRRKAELLECKRMDEERIRRKAHQNEHRRVNNEFLDRVQSNIWPGGI